MKMKMALFGREHTVERVKHLLEEEREIDMVPFIYTKAEETADLLDTVFHCDIYVFTEFISYLYVKDTIDRKRLPAVHVEIDPYTITANLYRLQCENSNPPQRIAFDAYRQEFMDEVIRELGFLNSEIHSFLHSTEEKPDIGRLISYYSTLWNEKRIDHVLASSEEIAEMLSESGIPASAMRMPELHLRQVIEQAKNRLHLSRSQNNQLVTGFVTVKGTDGAAGLTGEEREALDSVRGILENFTKSVDASFVETRESRFQILGSEKLLYHLREHYRSFPLLQELKHGSLLPVYLGFGLGLNAGEAQNHAELALKSCAYSDNSICYIVNEREEIIGPIGVKKEIDTSSLYRALIHDAKLNNELSYNFIDFITNRNNEPFSTNDVALFYKVTKRSAERTVNKLLTGQVIKIAGEERPYKKGRPRKLFTLNH